MHEYFKKILVLVAAALAVFSLFVTGLPVGAQKDATPLAVESLALVAIFAIWLRLALQKRSKIYGWYPARKYEMI